MRPFAPIDLHFSEARRPDFDLKIQRHLWTSTTNSNRAALVGLLLVYGCAVVGSFSCRATTSAIGVALAFYIVTGLGISLGYHRYLSHRSFTLARPIALVVAACGALALQGGPLEWAATHRAHHAHTDRDGDPHGAHVGMFWAHVGWLLGRNPDRVLPSDYARWIPELANDGAYVAIERWYLPLNVLCAFALFAVGGTAWLVWGFFIRVCVVHQITWLVNSLLHDRGTRRYESSDRARNNALLAPFAFGEAWHNNHHAFPHSARIGHAWYEFDPTWLAIVALKRCGLARDVRLASREQRARKRVRAHDHGSSARSRGLPSPRSVRTDDVARSTVEIVPP